MKLFQLFDKYHVGYSHVSTKYELYLEKLNNEWVVYPNCPVSISMFQFYGRNYYPIKEITFEVLLNAEIYEFCNEKDILDEILLILNKN
jgi:hypothetical protein